MHPPSLAGPSVPWLPPGPTQSQVLLSYIHALVPFVPCYEGLIFLYLVSICQLHVGDFYKGLEVSFVVLVLEEM